MRTRPRGCSRSSAIHWSAAWCSLHWTTSRCPRRIRRPSPRARQPTGAVTGYQTTTLSSDEGRLDRAGAPRSSPHRPADGRSIRRAVRHYATTQRGDVRKLEGEQDRYRLRVGEYRVIFRYGDGRLIVVVLQVGHRRDVYRS